MAAWDRDVRASRVDRLPGNGDCGRLRYQPKRGVVIFPRQERLDDVPVDAARHVDGEGHPLVVLGGREDVRVADDGGRRVPGDVVGRAGARGEGVPRLAGEEDVVGDAGDAPFAPVRNGEALDDIVHDVFHWKGAINVTVGVVPRAQGVCIGGPHGAVEHDLHAPLPHEHVRAGRGIGEHGFAEALHVRVGEGAEVALVELDRHAAGLGRDGRLVRHLQGRLDLHGDLLLEAGDELDALLNHDGHAVHRGAGGRVGGVLLLGDDFLEAPRHEEGEHKDGEELAGLELPEGQGKHFHAPEDP
mmetsp:Transcript_63744/g.201616  ORF Transcript_63744/g.201616 Transcript_63744/m.201616 type:complete len:301 (+) Transcript_63744:1529-2431(+)